MPPAVGHLVAAEGGAQGLRGGVHGLRALCGVWDRVGVGVGCGSGCGSGCALPVAAATPGCSWLRVRVRVCGQRLGLGSGHLHCGVQAPHSVQHGVQQRRVSPQLRRHHARQHRLVLRRLANRSTTIPVCGRRRRRRSGVGRQQPSVAVAVLRSEVRSAAASRGGSGVDGPSGCRSPGGKDALRRTRMHATSALKKRTSRHASQANHVRVDLVGVDSLSVSRSHTHNHSHSHTHTHTHVSHTPTRTYAHKLREWMAGGRTCEDPCVVPCGVTGVAGRVSEADGAPPPAPPAAPLAASVVVDWLTVDKASHGWRPLNSGSCDMMSRAVAIAAACAAPPPPSAAPASAATCGRVEERRLGSGVGIRVGGLVEQESVESQEPPTSLPTPPRFVTLKPPTTRTRAGSSPSQGTHLVHSTHVRSFPSTNAEDII